MHRIIEDGPTTASHCVILAHGAGAPMDSDWMNKLAVGLGEADLRVIRFEFPYMAQRRDGGKQRPPNPTKVLLATWLEVLAQVGHPGRLVIGGKSMGGRMASMIADEVGVAGLVCLGYPFHPPGKPHQLRTEHLLALRTPTLVIQGERDPFGGPEEVADYALSEQIEFHWLPDGDHGFKPRKKSGFTEEAHLQSAVRALLSFVKGLE